MGHGPERLSRIGDPEYVCIYERIVDAIVKVFNAELLFVSASFDTEGAIRLEILMLLKTVFAYTLAKLQEIQPKLAFCLEGGYNLQTISLSSEACVRVLIGENFLLDRSDKDMDLEEIRNSLIPNSTALKLAKYAREYFGIYWPQLESERLSKYDQIVQANVKLEKSLCSGDIKHVRVKGDRFLKFPNNFECKFYEEIQQEESKFEESIVH